MVGVCNSLMIACLALELFIYLTSCHGHEREWKCGVLLRLRVNAKYEYDSCKSMTYNTILICLLGKLLPFYIVVCVRKKLVSKIIRLHGEQCVFDFPKKD